MKVAVEWKDGTIWRTSNIQTQPTRNGNKCFNHKGKFYVFKTFTHGAEVVTRIGKEPWTVAGRIVRNVIFLGDGLSWTETLQEKFKHEQSLPLVVW